MPVKKRPAHEPPAPRHGGDLAFARQRYGEPAGGWLDLSTGINPLPWPAPDPTAADLSRLPDRQGLADLLAAARNAYGVPPEVAAAAVPGSEIALRLLPLTTASTAVAIITPTYASHTDAWTAAGHSVTASTAVEMMPDDASVVIVANPNNPDGRTTDPAKLVALAEQLGDAGGFLVVDEAFADVAPDISLVPDLAGLPAVVLRSFGKFYGLAGLRLGFLIGDRSIVSLVEQLLGDWPVSGPAVAIGAAALADDDWRDTTRRRLATDADRFGDILASHRLHTIGGTDLFALVEDDDAPEIHDRLARQGIWTRVFADRPRWLRLGLPPPRGFDRLDRALRNVR